MDTVCTATDYANFFHLRIHPDAEPHICMLAKTMKQQLDLAKPVQLIAGEWHLPYITEDDQGPVEAYVGGDSNVEKAISVLRKMSVARCAWVSYTDPLGKKASIEQEVALHDKLVVSEPLHATPAEHQATPDDYDDHGQWAYGSDHWGNLRGWRQYRKMLPGENYAPPVVGA
jgi:hypothetical protein